MRRVPILTKQKKNFPYSHVISLKSVPIVHSTHSSLKLCRIHAAFDTQICIRVILHTLPPPPLSLFSSFPVYFESVTKTMTKSD